MLDLTQFPVITIDNDFTTDDVQTLDQCDVATSVLETIITSIECQLADEHNDDKTWRFNAQKALRMKRLGLTIIQRKRAVFKRDHKSSRDQQFIVLVKDLYPDIFHDVQSQISKAA